MVEDAELQSMIFKKKLELNFGKEFIVYWAKTMQEARDYLKENDFVFALLDNHIDTATGEESGIEFAKYLDANYPNLRYCFLSSCERSNIAGASTETNLSKIFNKG